MELTWHTMQEGLLALRALRAEKYAVLRLLADITDAKSREVRLREIVLLDEMILAIAVQVGPIAC